MRRADACAAGAMQLKNLGFTPDIILGHHGWGEMLNLVDVFPGVPILGYFEFFYRIEKSDVNFDPEFPIPATLYSGIRAKNAINFQALALNQYGQVATVWQKGTYPDWAQKSLELVEEGVDLEFCKPNPMTWGETLQVGSLSVTPQQKLITYVARNLEPYRGFHTFMRALPRILAERRDVIVSVVGGDEVSYGAPHPKGPWRKVMLAELRGRLDLSRVHFLGQLPYDEHLSLLKRSNAHVYLSYPFVASWSLREAMACGCVIIGWDIATVTEFIKHKQTGIIVPALDYNAIATAVLETLETPNEAIQLRRGARAYAERRLGMRLYIERYRALIERISCKKLVEPPVLPQPGSSLTGQPLHSDTYPIGQDSAPSDCVQAG